MASMRGARRRALLGIDQRALSELCSLSVPTINGWRRVTVSSAAMPIR